MKRLNKSRQSRVHPSPAALHFDSSYLAIPDYNKIHLIIALVSRTFTPVVNFVVQLVSHTKQVCSHSTLNPAPPGIRIRSIGLKVTSLVGSKQGIIIYLILGY